MKSLQQNEVHSHIPEAPTSDSTFHKLYQQITKFGEFHYYPKYWDKQTERESSFTSYQGHLYLE